MDTRRSFIKKSALLSGAAAVAQLIPPSIQKALAINPALNSTYLDAEHIVFLMQENRSFDHTFGTLKGVRGFNDPRAITLPNNNKVWLQTNKNGETFSPFRLDIKDSKITWMGSLPHSRESQMEARNKGFHDNWLEAKRSDDKAFEHMPLTMGHYTREDIPFYYALADAFTVCDHHFCSSLTGTSPNRSYFWSGSARAKQDENEKAFLLNEDYDNDNPRWQTFPELLEANDVSWKVYQNEIAVDGGFKDGEEEWLGNFGDNVLEYFEQYNVKLSKRYVDHLPKKIEDLKNEIQSLNDKIKNGNLSETESGKASKTLSDKKNDLQKAMEDQQKYSAENFSNLFQEEKNIHEKAFVANTNDPFQHELTSLNYEDENVDRKLNIPKGDIFHQFRNDVENGKLATVSWLVAPENFSDHPSAPWFGSWYVSEAMDILTQNPEVWKKTIFVLTYDENDGYFDHVAPFVAPDTMKAATGKASEGIDTSAEFTTDERFPGTIGLGYRVPLVICSPWSRGGYVNSQVFDHTSSLQFLETFLNQKFKKNIRSANITDWRRTVCGDLTSVFRKDEAQNLQLQFIQKDGFLETIYNAKFKAVPNNFKALTKKEIAEINTNSYSSHCMAKQEKGVKPACALPYELYSEGKLSADKKSFQVQMKAANEIFGNNAHGVAFNIFSNKKIGVRAYAVAANDILQDDFLLNDFENKNYSCCVHGPNGFFRRFEGSENDPQLEIKALHSSKADEQKIVFILNNESDKNFSVSIKDNSYKQPLKIVEVGNSKTFVEFDLTKSYGWYDFEITVNSNNIFKQQFAGHIETGKESITDPLMGRTII